jgi:peptidoglycan lytic transglycosylase G
VAGGAAAGAAWLLLKRPGTAFAGERFLTIEKGATSRSIARQLAAAGVVDSEWYFLAARALRPRAILQAGEYRFSVAAPPLEVLDRLIRGDIYLEEFSIPEGYNLFDIAAALERAGLAPSAGFLAAARNPAAIRDLDPEAPSLEGYLFPDTYRVPRRITPEELCRVFTRRFRAVWRQLHPEGGANVHAAVTLASLVEKETARGDDRATVASVYVNRLRIGMKLDCDPTTIYAALLEGRYRGTIYRSDLDRDHPYNTYRRPGLPPGPIANPGEASLRAALHPAQTDYLFFVAEPGDNGRHVFSKDPRAHQAAVARYRAAHAKSETKPKKTARRMDHAAKSSAR